MNDAHNIFCNRHAHGRMRGHRIRLLQGRRRRRTQIAGRRCGKAPLDPGKDRAP